LVLPVNAYKERGGDLQGLIKSVIVRMHWDDIINFGDLQHHKTFEKVEKFRALFFAMFCFIISGLRSQSAGSWSRKGTDESTLG